MSAQPEYQEPVVAKLNGIATHDKDSQYEMKISLTVLDDLGIRLYSNIPAVLSELVANAWDADAESVEVSIDRVQNRIEVIDTGHGMTTEDIKNKYLTVGYRKRDNEPEYTAKGRRPMGRKGIGKLSAFSIAKTVEVQTVRNGERSALRMNSDDIKAVITSGRNNYKPIDLGSDKVDIDRGTKIILTDLKRNVSSATDDYLRKRLARRFSIIGPKNDFNVQVNGQVISAQERDYYHLLQFMWYLGPDSKEYADRCKNLSQEFEYSDVVTVNGVSFPVRGWIGTVQESGKLDDDTNTIVIFANGKLIHEDVLEDLNETGVYANFLIGEIDADFMDRNKEEDIVTSARQSVQKDSDRYIALKEFVRKLLKTIQNNWTGLRNEEGSKQLLQEKGISRWYDRLPGDQQKVAQRLLGKINSLGLPDARSKREVVKANMLAFERLVMDEQLSLLDRVNTQEQLDVLMKVIGNVNELERVHYHQIARGRVDIIKSFEDIVDDDKKERIIQDYLAKYLWLLDPSWEMASGTSRIEERITTEFKNIESSLSPEQVVGRVDIRYRTITGSHVIVELKRYSVKTSVYELGQQISKYKNALEIALEENFPNYLDLPVTCICVLGSTPREGREETNKVLGAIDAQFVTYDTLIQRARNSYEEFLEAQQQISELLKVIDAVDDDFKD